MPAAWERRVAICSGLLRRSASTHARTNPTASSLTLKGEQLGPTTEEAHRTLRLRKDGTPLPLPPLLDPIVLKERSKWEQPKAKPDVQKLAPFQRRLLANPYAHILASPVRECRATHHFFPSALLTTLHPRPHPQTGDPWLLPVNLTTPKKHNGVPYRFLGRQNIANHLGVMKNWRKGIYQRMREQLGGNTEKLVWRDDMPDLILKLLRRLLVGKLQWYFRDTGRLIPVPSPRTEDIEGVDNVSCVLLLGSLKTRADEIHELAVRKILAVDQVAVDYADGMRRIFDPLQGRGFPQPWWWKGPIVPRLQPRIRFPELEFKTLQYRGRRVPLYSLEDLLGEESMKELIEGSKLEGERCVVMKSIRPNVATEILLMQLQAYLVTPGPLRAET